MYKYSFPIKVSMSSLSETIGKVIDGVNKNLDNFNQGVKLELWTTMASVNVTCGSPLSQEQIGMLKKEITELYNKTLEPYHHMVGDPEITII